MPDAQTLDPWRRELRATLQLAAPLALANLLWMAIGTTDVIFVAQLGQEQLAASSLAVTQYMLISWALTGLTGAVAPLVAAELGRRRHAVREVRRSVRMALWLAIGTGLAGAMLCGWGEAFMLLTGQDPHISELGGTFLDIIRWAIPGMVVGSVQRTFVAALGRPMLATAITAVAILVNALGNWVFIFGHWGVAPMGLEGSALASVVTAYATVAAYALVIARDRRLRRYRLLGNWWRAEWQRLRELIRIGVPIACIIIAEGGFFSSAAYLMGRIGAAQLAAHTVALQVAALAFQVPFGVGQAATIRVGYHFGAADREGIRLAGLASLLIAFGFSFFGAGAMLLFPREILRLYVDVADPTNAAMVAPAVQFLAVAALFQLFDGIQAVAAGALRGLQDTRMPMAIALFGYWLPGFGLSLGLGLFTPLGGLGVWIGLAVGLVVVAILLLQRWRRRAVLGLLPG
ncbi:MATE family efflux transporter [Novosphingobium sp.]|uniref:MATE family efflux transporter n=1 Tax=Novosphingobium sp. TaxID=1874826 RepID=UPI00286D3260|nr:MATE family efflux transporter [Novosphingobium sp.]